jgi:hypothetical protein
MRKEQLIGWSQNEIHDRNANGIDDDIEPPPVDIAASAMEMKHKLENNTSTDPTLAAGDVDASWDLAESAGDDTPGSGTSTPDQSVVDDIGRAVGVTYQDNEDLRPGGKEHDRDVHRWELDPASSDDFLQRSREEHPPKHPTHHFSKS